ncbi:MAG: class I SAM-dependent methyltransferase [Cyanobacteriota bacterium]|nr:class I SAM-dependent methyltransferase [Cyanobacteriota bacterium]
MQRRPEPELMNDLHQVRAYAAADFSDGDQHTAQLVDQLIAAGPVMPAKPRVLDLGCGPGNITLLLARELPQADLIGIDGAESMLSIARERAAQLKLNIAFQCRDLRDLPGGVLAGAMDLIVSNSLLHHLHQPSLLWEVTRSLAAPGCRVLHRDLRRPTSDAELRRLQAVHLPDAPEVLRQDFIASLAAAFEPAEVEDQLRQAGLDGLSVSQEGDRYLVVSGLVG